MFWLDYLYNTDLCLTKAYSSFTVLIHAMGRTTSNNYANTMIPTGIFDLH